MGGHSKMNVKPGNVGVPRESELDCDGETAAKYMDEDCDAMDASEERIRLSKLPPPASPRPSPRGNAGQAHDPRATNALDPRATPSPAYNDPRATGM